MESIIDLIKNDRPTLEKITISTYARKVNTLLKDGFNLENYEETISRLIEKYKLKTIKSFITSIIVYLKAKKEEQSVISKYSSELLKTGDKITKEEEKNAASEKEADNFTSRKEIEDIISNLQKSITSEEVSEGNYKLFDFYQQYLVLNLYYLIPPLRNDYVDVLVDSEQTIQEDKNYINLTEKKLILNRYKTKNTYGKGKVISLPVKLTLIIRRWMDLRKKIYPQLENNNFLLLNKNLKSMSQVNLTHYLNKIFKRKISSTMLRKSYITEKYPVIYTVEDMSKDASDMLHSVSMQQSTYRKKL